MATKIDEVCRMMVETVDDALACTVFDLGSGELLGSHNCGVALPDAAIAAAAELVQSSSIARFERALRVLRGLPARDRHGVREIHVSSTDREILARTMESRSAGMMLVMKKTTNVGMGYAQLRAAGFVLEPLVPELPKARTQARIG
ncbi:MAG TPA: hypothetical protein VFP80_15275 [Thermoanaerobaculia bacterium]|nr:hypothetical protein [Thermoanaerobaculia bacterium]